MPKITFPLDRSFTIRVTPSELKEMLADFGKRYLAAKQEGYDFSVEELSESYFSVQMAQMEDNDPTKVISNN